MRQLYFNIGLSIPCKFVDDNSISLFQEYLDARFSEIQILPESYEDLTFTVSSITCEAYDLLQVVVDISGLPATLEDDYDEDTFISEYTSVIEGYIYNTLVPQLNAACLQDSMLNSLPDAYCAFIDSNIYVGITPGQQTIDLVCWPAEVSFNLNSEDLVSDLYYTSEM